MPNLRQRPVQDSYVEELDDDDDVTDLSHSSESDDEDEHEQDEEEIINAHVAKEDEEGGWISALDILRVLFALSLFVGATSYFLTSDSFIFQYQRPWFTNVPEVMRYLVSFTLYLSS
jgi:hypothetical protein